MEIILKRDHSRHDEILNSIVKKHNAERYKFLAAVRAVGGEIGKEDVPPGSLNPDAWSKSFDADGELLEIICYEVVVTSGLTHGKLDLYSHLWWILDNEEVGLRLVEVDRYGVERDIPLCDIWYDMQARLRAVGGER